MVIVFNILIKNANDTIGQRAENKRLFQGPEQDKNQEVGYSYYTEPRKVAFQGCPQPKPDKNAKKDHEKDEKQKDNKRGDKKSKESACLFYGGDVGQLGPAFEVVEEFAEKPLEIVGLSIFNGHR